MCVYERERDDERQQHAIKNLFSLSLSLSLSKTSMLLRKHMYVNTSMCVYFIACEAHLF